MIIRRPEDIGALVRDRRRELGLTQTQLAAKVGVSQRYISHLERGKKTLQLGLVLRVLEELGVRLAIDGSQQQKNERKAGHASISIDQLVDG